MAWYAKDCLGALTGIQTGLVEYASLLEPEAGAVVLIGSAALSSCV